jgi:outer membrane protein assembly factor BamB
MSRAKIFSVAKYVLACSASILWLAASGSSQTISVSPNSNPPNSTTLVSGSGFSAGTEVDIYFDTADLAMTVTDDTGSFSKIALQVPAAALPGEHTVSAKEPSTGASAQTPFLVNTNWPEFGMHSNRDGYNKTETMLSPATVGGLKLLWKTTTNAVCLSGSPPAVVNGTLYIGGNASEQTGCADFYALNAATGAVRWKSFAHDDAGTSSPDVTGGLVYYGSDSGGLYVLNALTGKFVSAFGTGTICVCTSPNVVAGNVYFGDEYPAIIAEGKTANWKHLIDSQIYSSPAVVNGIVYAGSIAGSVYALNATNGSHRWKYVTGGAISATPAVVNGILYIDSADGNVYALNAATGALVWKQAVPFGTYDQSSPAVANGVVYVGSQDGNVYALDAVTGTVKWKYLTGGYIQSSPAVANGVVYIGSSDGNLYALDASSGAVLWSYTIGGGASPIVVNGMVYLADSYLYAFGL